MALSSNSPSQTLSIDERATADAAARHRIGPWSKDDLPDLTEFEPDTNFVVRAAAGSGKTTALVARMVALIRIGAAEPSDLAAITFTRKAAGEMEGRFYEELGKAAKIAEENGHAEERRRLRSAEAAAQQSFIGTVHAFCGRILREHAFEAKLPPDFAVGAEEDELEPVRRRVWHAHLTNPPQGLSSAQEDLYDLGVTPSELEGLYATLSRYPELAPYVAAPDTAPDLDEAVQAVRQFVDAWQERRPDVPLKEPGKIWGALNQLDAFFAHHPVQGRGEKAEVLRILHSAYSERKYQRVKASAWGEDGSESKAAAEQLRDEAFPDIFESVLQPTLDAWGAHVHEKATRYVQPAAEAYLQQRRTGGLLTHHDVLYWTRELLRDHLDIRASVRERSPRLLVDEFQDTDPLQAEILFYLTSTDRANRDWRTCRPRPGSLFIVGDDKQSIYRFRRADITVFNEVVRQIQETGGDVVDLYKNFRSHAQICDFCDETFQPQFDDTAQALASAAPDSSSNESAEQSKEDATHQDGEGERGAQTEDRPLRPVQAEYARFVPARPKGRDDTSLRLIDCAYVYRYSPAELARDDAAQIAAFIREAVDAEEHHSMASEDTDTDAIFPGGAGYEDFLVLTRKKSRLSVYAEALAKQDIPFTVTGSEDLGASSDVYDLLAMLRCAMRPDDPVAALAYLRSGVIGFDADDLYAYKRACDETGTTPFRYLHKPLGGEVAEALGPQLRKRCEDAWGLLRDVRSMLQAQRPSRALPGVMERAGLWAAASAPLDLQQRSMRLGQLVRIEGWMQQKAESGATCAEIIRNLHDLVHSETSEDGLTLKSGSGNAVRVMNVHQAKGLEAPVVFLAGPNESSGHHSPTTHVIRGTDDGGPPKADGNVDADSESAGDASRDRLVAPVTRSTAYTTSVEYAPLGWSSGASPTFEDIEEAHEEAETTRLLYVAATRAERLLVVSRCLNKGGTPNPKGTWAPIAEQMGEKEVPVLTVSEERKRTESTQAFSDAAFASIDEALEPTRQRIDSSSAESFQETTVTEEKGEGGTLSFGEGYGVAFGSVLHQVFESLTLETRHLGSPPKAPATEALMAALRDEIEERGERNGDERPLPEMATAASDMVTRFLKSSLMEDIQAASQVFPEYRFARFLKESQELQVPSPPSGTGPSRGPRVLRGVIDLAYKDAQGWHIVDYKTDKVAPEHARTQLPDHAYASQIQQYASIWADLSGEPVASGSLWFAHSGARIKVDVSEQVTSR